MNLTVQKIEPDHEVELIELFSLLSEIEEDTLPRGFWTVEEWNLLVERKWRIKRRIEVIKKKLSEEKVEYT